MNIGEQEQTVAAFQFACGFDQMLNALGAARDGENAKTMKAETGAMDVLLPRRFVGEKFSTERRTAEAAASNRHGGAVGFKKIKRPFAGLDIFQSKDFVRAQTQQVRTDIDCPMKWIAEFDAGCQIIFPNESNLSIPSTGFF